MARVQRKDVKPRIIGLETEFGVMHKDEHKDEKLIGERWQFLYEQMPCCFLYNGGRVYLGDKQAKGTAPSVNRVGHPEYASPECRFPEGLFDLVKYDKAGERIMQEFLPWASLYKNSRDEFQRRIVFGTHENYSTSMDELSGQLDPYFESRQVFTGSGVITEKGYGVHQKPWFAGTYHLYYTHDDSNLSRLEWRNGDTNMSELATFLKIGATALVLNLREDNPDPLLTCSVYPSITFEQFMQDLFFQRKLPYEGSASAGMLEGVGELNILEVQRAYFGCAAQHYGGKHLVVDKVLEVWDGGLTGLEQVAQHPGDMDAFFELTEKLRWIDWINKLHLLRAFMEAEGLPLQHEHVRSVALEYHNIDPEEGLYYATQKWGIVPRLIREEEVQKAMVNPPENTRAWIRGQAVRDYPAHACVEWNSIGFRECSIPEIFMLSPFAAYKPKYREVQRGLKKLGITPARAS